MIGGDRCIGELASGNHSIFEVITIDAIVLDSYGIELSDRAGLTTELTYQITKIVPELVEAAVCFGLDADLIVTGVGSGFDQFLAFRLRLSGSEQPDIHSRLGFAFCAFHSVVTDGKSIHVCSYYAPV
ncbi:MAG: hypothetical protein WCU80_03655 [Paludibacteraceae bacterium]|jgi:hypothetical protein